MGNALLDQRMLLCLLSAEARSPLMFAARISDAETVELLLSYGADKSLVSDEGKTALDYAGENAEEKNVQTILDLLAD